MFASLLYLVLCRMIELVSLRLRCSEFKKHELVLRLARENPRWGYLRMSASSPGLES